MPHIHELIDFTVAAYIVYEQKVLLIFHKKLNKWLPIGGHIELNENPEEALFREIDEECGLKPKIMSSKPAVQHSNGKFLYTPNFMDIHNISETHRHIGLTYFLKSDTDAVILEKDYHSEIKWFSLDEMKKSEYNVQSDVIYYSSEAIKRSKDENN